MAKSCPIWASSWPTSDGLREPQLDLEGPQRPQGSTASKRLRVPMEGIKGLREPKRASGSLRKHERRPSESPESLGRSKSPWTQGKTDEQTDIEINHYDLHDTVPFGSATMHYFGLLGAICNLGFIKSGTRWSWLLNLLINWAEKSRLLRF